MVGLKVIRYNEWYEFQCWMHNIHVLSYSWLINRACQWIFHNALFWKSQTHSVNESIYGFDGVFLEIPVKNCIVDMLLTCPICVILRYKYVLIKVTATKDSTEISKNIVRGYSWAEYHGEWECQEDTKYEMWMIMLHCSACILKFPGKLWMIAYAIFTKYLWEFKFKIASWEFY